MRTLSLVGVHISLLGVDMSQQRRYGHYTLADIAAFLGKSEAAVRKRLWRKGAKVRDFHSILQYVVEEALKMKKIEYRRPSGLTDILEIPEPVYEQIREEVRKEVLAELQAHPEFHKDVTALQEWVNGIIHESLSRPPSLITQLIQVHLEQTFEPSAMEKLLKTRTWEEARKILTLPNTHLTSAGTKAWLFENEEGRRESISALEAMLHGLLEQRRMNELDVGDEEYDIHLEWLDEIYWKVLTDVERALVEREDFLG